MNPVATENPEEELTARLTRGLIELFKHLALMQICLQSIFFSHLLTCPEGNNCCDYVDSAYSLSLWT